MVGLGATCVFLLVAYTFLYIIYTAPVREDEWIVIGIFGSITIWAGVIFYFLFQSTRATARYLKKPDDVFLMEAIDQQKRFWQGLCLLLLSIAIGVGLLFGFLFFTFARH